MCFVINHLSVVFRENAAIFRLDVSVMCSVLVLYNLNVYSLFTLISILILRLERSLICCLQF